MLQFIQLQDSSVEVKTLYVLILYSDVFINFVTLEIYLVLVLAKEPSRVPRGLRNFDPLNILEIVDDGLDFIAVVMDIFILRPVRVVR